MVGAGLAGLACALEAARRGHKVTLFEAGPQVGGQFRLAEAIPGKKDFLETVRYFAVECAGHGVELRLDHRASAADLAGFDAVVMATGILQRQPDLEGADHPMVVGYDDILSGRRRAGRRVAIIGCGPIAFDVAIYLLGGDVDAGRFLADWGVDRQFSSPGGLIAAAPAAAAACRIVMMQRRPGRIGGELSKTTGWIRKATVQRHGVEMLSGVTYNHVDAAGLHVTIDGQPRLIDADTVVVCAGQDPCRDLADAVAALAVPVHWIGGARDAAGLDAQRAIEEGTRLGLVI